MALIIKSIWSESPGTLEDPWALADAAMDRFHSQFPDLPPADEDEVFAVATMLNEGEPIITDIN